MDVCTADRKSCRHNMNQDVNDRTVDLLLPADVIDCRRTYMDSGNIIANNFVCIDIKNRKYLFLK